MSWFFLFGLLIGEATANEGLDGSLQEHWEQVRSDARWRSPYAAERTAFRDGLTALARVAGTCNEEDVRTAAATLAAADFAVERLEDGEDSVLVVREAVEHRGAGMVAIRCGSARPWVWQAPHALYDLSTGDIALQLFLESGARAVMWNTVHRYRALPAEKSGDPVHPADVTREFGSLFHAATVGLASGDVTLRFLQLHGYAQRSDFPWHAVVSTGDADRPPEALAKALTPVLGSAGAYGADVDILGGTANVQAKALRAWSEPRFLHFELSPAARRSLAEDPEMRGALLSALAQTQW
jgi:hypothetical protein